MHLLNMMNPHCGWCLAGMISMLGWNLFLSSLKWPNMTDLHCFHMTINISSFLKMYLIAFWGVLRRGTLREAFPSNEPIQHPLAFPVCLFMKQLPYCMIQFLFISPTNWQEEKGTLDRAFQSSQMTQSWIALLWTNLSFQETFPRNKYPFAFLKPPLDAAAG